MTVKSLDACTMRLECKRSRYGNVNDEVSPSRRGHNRLRTYGVFKAVFKTEAYCLTILACNIVLLLKSRCNVGPLQIETGKFEEKKNKEEKKKKKDL